MSHLLSIDTSSERMLRCLLEPEDNKNAKPNYACRVQRLIVVGRGFQSFLPACFHRWTVHNGNVYGLEVFPQHLEYLAATRNVDGTQCNMWVYNIATRIWTMKHICTDGSFYMPTNLGANFFMVHQDHFICTGGMNNIYEFSLSKDNTLKLTNSGGVKPRVMRTPCIKVDNESLYAIGGQDGEVVTANVHRLNLKTFMWELYHACDRLANYPVGFKHHALAHDDTFIYVLGGMHRTGYYDLRHSYAFDWRRKCWLLVKWRSDPLDGSFPKERTFLNIVQHRTSNGNYEVFIVGGVYEQGWHKDIWKLNLNERRWICIRVSLPCYGRVYSTVFDENGCMYIFGGGFSFYNQVNKMWLRPPSLLEMCWDAITHYNPNLRRHTTAALLKSGVPRQLAMRLKSF